MHHRSYRRRKERRGYALLTSMFVILVLTLLGTALLGMSSTSLRLSTRRIEGAQALNLAMGGLDEAVAALRENPDYSGFRSQSLGEGTVSVSVTTPAGRPDLRMVVSTGTVTGHQHAAIRRVRTYCGSGKIPAVFYQALAAKQTFGINGNVTVNSYPLTNRGDVHSNQNVELSGTSTFVYGKATATGMVTTTGSPTISGGMTSGVPPMVFPEVDPAFKEKATANGLITPAGGTLTVNDSTTVVRGKIVGNLSIGSRGATLSGVVWVLGSVTVGGPVLGKGTLVCEDALTISASGSYPAGDASNLLFITTSSSSTAVALGGNRAFKGSVYAPNGGVKLHGNPTLLGSILSNTITFSGNPVITRWTEFDQDPPEYPTFFQSYGWEEL